MVELDSDLSRYDVPSAFEPIDDFSQAPTPALLAAKAEPLSKAKMPRAAPRPKSGRLARSGRRPVKAGSAAARSKARARSRRKPQETPKVLLGLASVAVVLVGVTVAYFFSRGGDETSPGVDASVAVEEIDAVPVDEIGDGPGTELDASTSSVVPLPPVVIFDAAAVGPIDATVEYTLAIGDGPGNAMYQLLIDDIPQAEPAAVLPPVTFAPGRHLLVVEITSPEGDTATDPVVVYATGPIPVATYRANLSSVDIAAEGWAEAVRQFDEYVGAGHVELQLMPSDWFPSLAPGYWNLFVDGFDNRDAALAYCSQFELAVPNDCFAQQFDPDASAGG